MKPELSIRYSTQTSACEKGQRQPPQAPLCEMLEAKLEPTTRHSTHSSACEKG